MDRSARRDAGLLDGTGRRDHSERTIAIYGLLVLVLIVHRYDRHLRPCLSGVQKNRSDGGRGRSQPVCQSLLDPGASNSIASSMLVKGTWATSFTRLTRSPLVASNTHRHRARAGAKVLRRYRTRSSPEDSLRELSASARWAAARCSRLIPGKVRSTTNTATLSPIPSVERALRIGVSVLDPGIVGSAGRAGIGKNP